MELNRKQIKSQARILVQNKWGSLFVITFVVMMLTGMGMFNNSQIDLVKQISHYNHASDYGSWDNREDNPLEEFDFDDQDEDDNPLEDFDGTGAITPVTIRQRPCPLRRWPGSVHCSAWQLWCCRP